MHQQSKHLCNNMIKLNNISIPINHYPDGTISTKISARVRQALDISIRTIIDWRFESNEELILLQFLVKHLHDNNYRELFLTMPYVPCARHDRAPSNEDVLYLKYFADIINSLGFKGIRILDPHSSVTQNLFHHLNIEHPDRMIERVFKEIASEEQTSPILFFPDEGAMKRYGNLCKQPYCFGIKQRDWQTGNILGLELQGVRTSFNGEPILMVDDICSKGTTFYEAAKILKEYNAGNIYLWVSHCENTIHDGHILDTDYIKRIYTTDSLHIQPHIKIEIMPWA